MGVEKFLRNGTSLKKAKGKNEQKTKGRKFFLPSYLDIMLKVIVKVFFAQI
jgi:hypothetical protein